MIYLPHSSDVLSAFEAIWAAMNAVHTWERLVQASIRGALPWAGAASARSKDPRRRAGEEAIRQSIAFMTNNLGPRSRWLNWPNWRACRSRGTRPDFAN